MFCVLHGQGFEIDPPEEGLRGGQEGESNSQFGRLLPEAV